MTWSTLFGSLFPSSHDALADQGRFLLGCCLIGLECIVCVANAILTQYIFEETELESPFIMTYIGISSMMIAFPIHRLTVRRAEQQAKKSSHPQFETTIGSFDSFADDLSRYQNYADLGDIFSRRAMCLVYDHDRTWNHRKHIMAAILIAPAMFLADWAFNAALLSTSIASATTLVSISSMFVYMSALALSLDFFSLLKMIGILLGVAGMALTAIHDGNSDKANSSNYAISDVVTYTYTYNSTSSVASAFEFPDTGMFGDVLAVLAAVAYATYTIQVRLFCPENEDLYSMNLLLGYIGVLAFIPLFPVAVWLFVSEQISMSWSTFGLVLCKGILDFLVTDYLLFRAIILMGPTAATVGAGMSIPIAFLGDLAMQRSDVLSWYSIVGALACIGGFLMVNLAPSQQPRTQSDIVGLEMEPKEAVILSNDHVII